jgi:tripartite-type tricarboxylate transporter receptor subunit TctC
MKRFLAIAAAALLAATLPAAAQDFPSRPVTLVVPNAPAGVLDVLARVLQPPLQALWKQSIVVDYKPGATTALGTAFTAKAPPDGYTLCVITTPHVINPAMRKLPFDTEKDLSGVVMLGVSSNLISATPGFPANSLAELVAEVKKHPGKYSYASPGAGSSMHLAMELLKQRVGLDIVHVPFKGSGPAYPELFSGRVELLIDPLFPTYSHVKAGKLKAIALTGSVRSAAAPEIPLVSEDFRDFAVHSLYAIVAPSATPRDIVAKIHRDISATLKMPDIAARIRDLGLDPRPLSPAELDSLFKTEIERWTRFVKSANIPTE